MTVADHLGMESSVAPAHSTSLASLPGPWLVASVPPSFRNVVVAYSVFEAETRSSALEKVRFLLSFGGPNIPQAIIQVRRHKVLRSVPLHSVASRLSCWELNSDTGVVVREVPCFKAMTWARAYSNGNRM